MSENKGSKRNELELLALTGVRGFAAIVVVFSHLNLHLIGKENLPKIFHAQPFVDLFFLLSGFVMSYVYCSKAVFEVRFFKKFYLARFARIYPLYIFACALSGLTAFWIWQQQGGEVPKVLVLGSLLKQLFLLNAVPYFHTNMLVFTAWSVSIEWWTYICMFPILVLVSKYRKAISSSFFIPLILVPMIYYLYQPGVSPVVMFGWPALMRGFVGFFIGWITHSHFNDKTSFYSWSVKFGDVIAVAILISTLLISTVIGDHAWFALLLFPSLILALTSPSVYFTKMLSSKAMVFLGDISYSVYLLHPIVLKYVAKFLKYFDLDSTGYIICFCVASISISILVSHYSYKYLELPMKNLFRPKMSGK